MITMQNWRVHVPPGGGMLGYETETGVARLAIQLDGAYEGWQFKLDTRREYQELNVFDFVHDGNMIYFDIVDELGLEAGRYQCQVRGEYGGKRQLSSSFSIYVGESIGGVTVLENVPVAELFQLEQRLTALKTQSEQLAQTATGQSESAVQAAEAALESAQQALESAREADASRQTAQHAAEAAARDAGTSEAAADRAESARADALTASAAAEEAANAAQAALESAQTAALAAQNAASAAATDRQAAEQAAGIAASSAQEAAAKSSKAAESASAAEESASAAAASAAAAAESERQAKASEEAAAESAAASKLDAQATAADRTAVAADKNAVAANRTAAETAAASAKTDAERIAALDTYSKREADVLLASKADQPYAGAEGAFIRIADSAGGMLGGIAIRGNSVQDGTPSPDAPVQIQSVQSPVALTVCGANLINDTPNAAVVNRGVTFSAADGGGTMIAGTSTGMYAQNAPAQYGFVQVPAGTYTVSVSVDGDTGGATIFAKFNVNGTGIKDVDAGKSVKIVLDNSSISMFVYVRQSGVTLDCVVRVMLVQGETAAPYEPYDSKSYSIPLVAADSEAYPDALELCRIDDVCDSLERRNGVWGVNKQIWEFTLTAPARFSETADTPGRYRMSPALPQKATAGTASAYSNIAVFRPWGQPNQYSWTVAVHDVGIYLSPPRGSSFTAEGINALLDELSAAGTPLTVVYQLNTPFWIPLSDEAQDVLDSIRLPAGIANIFATNSPAPDLELTYRKVVISLPTPTAEDAGKVPTIRADGTGYELIFRGSELLADVTLSGLQELHIRSIDYKTGVMELTEPLTIGSDGATLPGGFGGWGLGVDITKLQSLKNSVPKELLQKFGSYFDAVKRVDETHIQIPAFSSFTEPSALDLNAFWIAKSALVTLTDLPEFERLRFHVSTNGGTCSYIRLYDEGNSVIYGYCGVQSGTYGSYNTRIPAVSASGLGVSEGVLDGNSTLVLSGRSLGFNAAGSFVSTLTEQNYAVFDREKKVKKIEIRAEYGQMLNGSRVRVWKEA